MSEYVFNTHSNDSAETNAHEGRALVVGLLETLAELDSCLPGPVRPLKLPQYPWELNVAHEADRGTITLGDVIDGFYESGETRELAVFFDAMQCYAPADELLDDAAIEAILRLEPSGPVPGYEAVYEAICDAGLDAVQCAVVNGTLVSLDRPRWNFSYAKVECNGTCIEIDHASRVEHVEPVCERARMRAVNTLTTRNFEVTRQVAFPSLEWGQEVTDQISIFPARYLKLAFKRLASLDDIVRNWRATGSGQPDQGNLNFRSESKLTMDNYGNERRFRSVSGEVKTYEKHVWIDKGNRIHFIVDSNNRSIEIGYIGKHLSTWTN